MASVGLILNPEQKVFTTSGTIDYNATMNFYTSGASSVRQKVYHDKDQLVAQRNPVDFQYEDGGVVLYGDPTITYRQVIVNGSNVTVSTVDNVSPILPREQLATTMDVSTYSIVSDSGVNIPLTPGGSGQVVLDGLYIPKTGQVANYILGTKGNGTLFWRANGLILSSDTAPQTSGNLDCNLFSFLIDDGTGINDQNNNEALHFETVASATNYVKLSNSATGNPPVFLASGDDSNIGINIDSEGTGKIVLAGLSYPNADSTGGYALTTNGAGVLQFASLTQKLIKKQVTAITYQLLSSTTIPLDDTIPQSSEGTLLESVSYTPVSESSTLHITVSSACDSPARIALFVDSQTDALAAAACIDASGAPASSLSRIQLQHIEPSASTSARTYKIRGGIGASMAWGTSSSLDYGNTLKNYIIIEEYL